MYLLKTLAIAFLLTILTGCTNMEVKLAKIKTPERINFDEVKCIDIFKIKSDSEDHIKDSIRLKDDTALDLVDRWNNAESLGLCKFFPKYWIKVKFNNGLERKFRINGNSIKENNDYCFEFAEYDFEAIFWKK